MERSKTLLFIAVILLLSVATPAQAQDFKSITILVSGSDYDNPRVKSLREFLKSDSKVTGVNNIFNNSTATITLKYAGTASDLWEEIPIETKSGFKVTTLDAESIKLQVLKGQAGSQAGTLPGKKNDCGTCEYFPVCNYDLTKSFEGKTYKGVRYDNGNVEYFHCASGEILKKWETWYQPEYYDEDYDPFTNTVYREYYYGPTIYSAHTALIIKTNVPIGTKWESNGETWELLSKGTSITHNGKLYQDVLAIKEHSTGDYINYYAKGVGYIKSEKLVSEKQLKEVNDASINKKLSQIISSGVWKSVLNIKDGKYKGRKAISLYIFKSDGSFEEYYNYSFDMQGNMTLDGKFNRSQGLEICKWSISQKTVMNNCSGNNWHIMFNALEKPSAKDPEEQEIYLKFYRPDDPARSEKTYFRIDSTKDQIIARYDLESEEDRKTTLQTVDANFKGIVDTSLIGVWQMNFDSRPNDLWLKLEADGTGALFANPNIDNSINPGNYYYKFHWRVDGNMFERIILEKYNNGKPIPQDAATLATPERLGLQKLNHPNDNSRVLYFSTNYYYQVKNKRPFSPAELIIGLPSTLKHAMDSARASMKGKIDVSLAGIWESQGDKKWVTYYIFNNDGTFYKYHGEMIPQNLEAISECYWRINGNEIELLSPPTREYLQVMVSRWPFVRKANDTITISGGIYKLIK